MIAREGTGPVAVALVVAVLISVNGAMAWAATAWLVVAVLAYVYYEPSRKVPAAPLGVVSPVNGVAVRVGQGRDPWLRREATQMRVKLPVPGVTALLSPTEGKVVKYWTEADPFDGPAAVRSDAESPHCYAVQVRTDEMDDIVFSVSSTRPLSRCRLYVSPGERVGQGQRQGFVYFADFVDVLAPPGSRALVDVGDRVRAGSTVLARMIHD